MKRVLLGRMGGNSSAGEVHTGSKFHTRHTDTEEILSNYNV